MSDFQQQYALWDDFLRVWPSERLATMTLDEYTQAGSKDSFTYWIESRLQELGSIWGGSAFKFGVFSRKDTEDKATNAKLSYSESHAWYSTLGKSAQEAFEKVREYVTQISKFAIIGDVDSIEAFPYLGEAFKWKIAFHYQNRQSPKIAAIFMKAALAAFIGETASQSMAALQKAVLNKRPDGVGILEFGKEIWETWSQKNINIWKLSHGRGDFSDEERQYYLETDLGVMHGETAKKQGEKFQEIPIGTLFYLCHGNENLLLVGQFTSAPEPCDKGDGWLQRHYRILKPAIKKGSYQGGKKGWTPNYNSTFKRIGENDLPEFEASLLKPYFNTSLAELASLTGNPFEQERKNEVLDLNNAAFKSSKTSNTTHTPFNRIYYGPPGTGKTYTLTRLLKREYEQAVHSITTEEWKNQMIAEQITILKWWEGAAASLYDLGGKAKVATIAKHSYIQAIANANGSNRNLQQTLWSVLQSHAIDESATVKVKKRTAPAVFDKTDDSVWLLAGDWKEACADLITLVDQIKQGRQNVGSIQRYTFVTFHQSYGYEEFVEGLRPVLTNGADQAEIAYEIRPGAFKELCNKARQVPDQRFAMVIDEINRGNISKILGELITLIETDKRDPLDGSPPPTEVTLAYSGEKFSVPANVDILGTMNTADRSLALLDSALRRRFDFVALMPDTRETIDPTDPDIAPLAGLMVTLNSRTIDVRMMLERINERIEALYDRDHCIGHAYFTRLKSVTDGQARFDALVATFRNRIIPLLEEYFFEDWQKIRMVLADNQKQDQQTQFITESKDHNQDLETLFGNDHGLESYTIKRRYALNDIAFANPHSYIGVYESLRT